MSRRRTLAVAVVAMCVAIPISDASASRQFGSRPLARPMKGPDVRTLQRLLTAWGLPLEIDGRYGLHTTRRVRSWERNSNRRINGRVSRTEARALQAAVARGETLPGYVPPAPEPTPTTTAPATGAKATLRSDGTAVAPTSAPAAVKAIIAAGNKIHDYPYKYGGGHGTWNDDGYDCSGSMSYVLHAAGLLRTSLDSTGFMSWGRAGKGIWVTTYANPSHSYMVVAGLRFDTSGLSADGSRWHSDMRSSSGYTVRHPSGL